MALGKIKADTLEHSTAGSVDTQFAVKGSVKSSINFNGQNVVSIRDSLNVSSLTDNASGRYQINNSTNFGNANYSITGSTGYYTSGTDGANMSLSNGAANMSTSVYGIETDTDSTDTDHTLNCTQAVGDLA